MEINHIEVEKKYFSSAERRVQKFVDGVFNRNLNLVSVFRPAGQTHAHKIAALLPLCSLSFLEKFGAACKAANICYPPNILLSDTQLNFFQKYAIWKGKGFDFPGLAVDFALESMKDEKNLGTNLFQIHQELFNLLKKNFVSSISLEEFYSSNMKDNPIWHSQSENASEFRSVVFNAYPKLRSPFLKEVLISQQADVQSVADSGCDSDHIWHDIEDGESDDSVRVQVCGRNNRLVVHTDQHRHCVCGSGADADGRRRSSGILGYRRIDGLFIQQS